MPVVVTTVAVAAGLTAVVAVILRVRLERFAAPTAQQAPVQTAIQMMTMQTTTQMNGTRMAMTMPAIIPADKALKSV